MSERASGLVTLLFTDLVASTELLARLGDDAAEEVRRSSPNRPKTGQPR